MTVYPDKHLTIKDKNVLVRNSRIDVSTTAARALATHI